MQTFCAKNHIAPYFSPTIYVFIGSSRHNIVTLMKIFLQNYETYSCKIIQNQ